MFRWTLCTCSGPLVQHQQHGSCAARKSAPRLSVGSTTQRMPYNCPLLSSRAATDRVDIGESLALVAVCMRTYETSIAMQMR
jgi:hypothetical protein